MIVGLYARVSTKNKEQNPENQLIRLREYCKSRNWDYREYVDFASGAKKDRPSLKSINVIGEENRAICNWEAPSVGDMQNLPKSVNPPTKHEVYDAQKIF